MGKSVNIITRNKFSKTAEKYTLTFGKEKRFTMRKNKVLEYLKRDGIESELECMTKEDFNTSELEYLSKYYHLQL